MLVNGGDTELPTKNTFAVGALIQRKRVVATEIDDRLGPVDVNQIGAALPAAVLVSVSPLRNNVKLEPPR